MMLQHPLRFFLMAVAGLSLLLRVVGDLTLWMPGQKWGGLLNVLAVLLFLANNVRAVKLGQSEGHLFSHL